MFTDRTRVDVIGPQFTSLHGRSASAPSTDTYTRVPNWTSSDIKEDETSSLLTPGQSNFQEETRGSTENGRGLGDTGPG